MEEENKKRKEEAEKKKIKNNICEICIGALNDMDQKNNHTHQQNQQQNSQQQQQPQRNTFNNFPQPNAIDRSSRILPKKVQKNPVTKPGKIYQDIIQTESGDDNYKRNKPSSNSAFQTAGQAMWQNKKKREQQSMGRYGSNNQYDRRYQGNKGSYHKIENKLHQTVFGSNLGGGGQLKLNRKRFVNPQKGERKKYEERAEKSQFLNHEKLQGIDEKFITLIESEILDSSRNIGWNDIAGLQYAKNTIQEIIVWPMLRPDIFTGLRAPPKGLLFFGPPGTGKTMLAKAVASESKSTFFSISASSLTSKWVGEGEKMVKTLFAMAVIKQPSIIFIDEIDSLLTSRSSKENEGSRRIKTEFFIQLDGTRTAESDRVLVIGATNLPGQLDDAVRRRFVKRLYIPLPNIEGRTQLYNTLINQEISKGNNVEINKQEINQIVQKTKGYSGADISNLCAEAMMMPLREITDISNFNKNDLRNVTINDFLEACTKVKSSVGHHDLIRYHKWNKQYGTFNFELSKLET